MSKNEVHGRIYIECNHKKAGVYFNKFLSKEQFLMNFCGKEFYAVMTDIEVVSHDGVTVVLQLDFEGS